MVEDEPYFFTEIVDNDLCAVTLITKHFMSEHKKGIIRSQWWKLWWKMWKRGSMAGRGSGDVRGVEKISSTGSKLIAIGEDCLDGCDCTGGGEVNGGGVVLGVFKTLLGEINGEVIGERGRETIEVDGGAFWLLEEIHVTWAHLEKKRIRVRLYTKSLKEIIIQTVEMTSPAIATASSAIAMTSGLDQDGVRIFKMAYRRSRLKINPRRFIEAAASRIL
nr:hypothetical protein [Tanacetum cinerariifolium]